MRRGCCPCRRPCRLQHERCRQPVLAVAGRRRQGLCRGRRLLSFVPHRPTAGRPVEFSGETEFGDELGSDDTARKRHRCELLVRGLRAVPRGGARSRRGVRRVRAAGSEVRWREHARSGRASEAVRRRVRHRVRVDPRQPWRPTARSAHSRARSRSMPCRRRSSSTPRAASPHTVVGQLAGASQLRTLITETLEEQPAAGKN